MSHQKELSSEWLAYVKKTKAGNSQGVFKTFDEHGTQVILEWTQTDIQSPKLAEFKQSICETASEILAPVEVQFLRAYPQAVSQELFLKPCAPFFEKGPESVNWKIVEETIKSTIKQFYLADLSKFGIEVIRPLLEDVYFLVLAKEEATKKILGFLMCSITPALPYGDVKVINLGLVPKERNRGLDKILMGSLLKIIPDVKRLFLFSRPTNDHEREAYQSMGFVKDQSPIQDSNHKINPNHLTTFEYKVEKSEILQNVAKSLGG